MPMFSVIVPTYNRAKYLPQCLESITAQSFRDWECVVVDDGSNDATAKIVADFVARNWRVRYARQANAGAAAARNTGVAVARGTWLAFLDSDDFYMPDALAALARAVERAESEGAQIVNGVLDGDFRTVDHAALDASVIVHDGFWSTLGFSREGPQLFLQTAAFHRDLVAAVGAFDTAYRTAEDREFLIRAAAASPVAEVQALVGYFRQAHGEGKSAAYLVSGEKITAARKIYSDLIDAPCVRERLAREGEGVMFVRLIAALLRTYDAAQAVRIGEIDRAAELLCEVDDHCGSPGEVEAFVTKLDYVLFYPLSSPFRAASRCAAWFASLGARVDAARHPRLSAALARHGHAAREFAATKRPA